ncbi:glycosyl hydrolase family 65 protein [Enterococcus sp. LJL51]|uniref:glycosyl hydrolase family 65 protein n=1 Tax=Enterococcus sp. LJL51 TaxID=3416656 RepID=UPI003CEDF463
MSWIISETGKQLDKAVDFGNKFLIGNGYFGYRGTLEEYTKKEMVACNLSGIYDQRGTAWREPVNAPNGLFTKLTVAGENIDLTTCDIEEHLQQLDMYKAVHQRKTVFKGSNGLVTVESERFASSSDSHLLVMSYSFSLEKTGEVRLLTGIDKQIWDINGPHLTDFTVHKETSVIGLSAVTSELGETVITAETAAFNEDIQPQLIDSEAGVFHEFTFTAEAGKTYTLTKTIAVYTSKDTENPVETALESSRKANNIGYEVLKEQHEEQWKNYWYVSDVEIEGDEEAQLALRYSIYQLLSIAPRKGQPVSIPARGLSGQTYKGAVFWDTEMFMLPFFLHTAPDVAKSLMDYRIRTLDGARAKAAEYGFKGAFYAWESQENGQDACSDYNVTDVFTKRPMRTYFRDKQIHISGDVAYGIWQTYLMTGDQEILFDGGAEVILECARFYYSYSYYRSEKEQFELIDVIGPDEYHERVYNNVYTNKIAAYTLDIALKTLEIISEKPDFYRALIEKLNYEEEILNLKKMKVALYIPEPDEETGVIEQFDDYFKLEDTTVDEVRSRLIDPKEYWGGAYGVASDTQIIKQADVVLMLNLFKEDYSKEVKKANWTYYEPRTEHGSSLSPCIYALLACDVGDPEWAYPYFMKTASVDLTGQTKQFAGTIYIGGTHPAANGGAWMAAVLGFGGLKIENGKLSTNPKLPKKWTKLSFKVCRNDGIYQVEAGKDGSKIWKR